MFTPLAAGVELMLAILLENLVEGDGRNST